MGGKIHILSGKPRNVAFSLYDYLCKGRRYLLWGFYRREYLDRVDKDDIVFLYATDPVKAIVARGRIVNKTISKEKYWPLDYESKEEACDDYCRYWGYRIEIDVNWTIGEGDEICEVLKRCSEDEKFYSELAKFGISKNEVDSCISEGKLIIRESVKSINADIAECINRKIETKMRQEQSGVTHKFNPNELELPKDNVDNAIALYREILKMLVDRDLVDKEMLKQFIDRGDHESAACRFYNDLRRLCVISIGHDGNWRDEIAFTTPLFKEVSKVWRCIRDVSSDAYSDDVYPEILLALTILYCIAKGSKCGTEAGVCRSGNIPEAIRKRIAEILMKSSTVLFDCLPIDDTLFKAFKSLVSSGGENR